MIFLLKWGTNQKNWSL